MNTVQQHSYLEAPQGEVLCCSFVAQTFSLELLLSLRLLPLGR